MTDEKRIAIKRIIIFTFLAFLPSYIIQIFLFQDGKTEHRLIGNLVMMTPALANILTRLVTKDDKDTLVKINFKGNGKYYLIALIYPLIISALDAAAEILFLVKDYSIENTVLHNSLPQSIYLLLTTTSMGAVIFFIGWGEEFGWRGYLTPQLEKVMSKPAALTVSGIIWGLWHAPAITQGLNFGKDYPLEPFSGIAAMCLSCILYGTLLSWLTEKTGSIIPAAICHSCVDAASSTFETLLVSPDAEYKCNDFWLGFICMVIVAGIVCITIIALSARKNHWLTAK